MMVSKTVLAVAGVVLAGSALSGCEIDRSSYAGRSYTMPPGYGMPGAGYAQAPGYQHYGRVATAAYAPARAAEQPIERAAATVEVTGPVPSAGGTAANGSPMVTITLPAVKLMVPLNGTLTYAAPPGAAATVALPAENAAAARPVLAAPAPLDIPVARPLATPAPLHYPVPAAPLSAGPELPATQPRGSYTAAPTTLPTPPMTPTASSFGEPGSAAGAPADQGSPPALSGGAIPADQPTRRSRPAGMVPPPPVWPRSATRDDTAPSDLPPPIPRSPSLYSNQPSTPYQP